MARRFLDLPLLVMAIVATAALGIFTGQQVESRRCRAQGGRILVHGLDHSCTRPDGSTVPIQASPSKSGTRATILFGGLATAGGIYLGLLRIVRPGRRSA